MNKWWVISVFLLAGCVKLDSFMFSEEQVASYQYSDYDGEVELPDLPAKYFVEDSMINPFSYPVNSENVQAVYIGEPWRIGVGDTIILYCHGNSQHMDKYWNRAQLLANVGGKHRFGVLMMDYQGFGASEGEASENNLNRDVEQAISWLKDWGMEDHQLMVYGYSLGSGPASEMTLGNDYAEVQKLILESPFASTDVMSYDATGIYVPISYTSTYEFDVAGRIADIQQPLLWLHGVDDAFLSMETHGEVVYDRHPGPKTAVRVDRADHADVPQKLGYATYLNVLEEFITTQ